MRRRADQRLFTRSEAEGEVGPGIQHGRSGAGAPLCGGGPTSACSPEAKRRAKSAREYNTTRFGPHMRAESSGGAGSRTPVL